MRFTILLQNGEYAVGEAKNWVEIGQEAEQLWGRNNLKAIVWQFKENRTGDDACRHIAEERILTELLVQAYIGEAKAEKLTQEALRKFAEGEGNKGGLKC